MKKKVVLMVTLVGLLLGLASCSLLDMFVTKYTVSFYSDNELIKKIEVKAGSLIDEPKIDIKEGYLFVGWYKDVLNPITKWDFSNDQVNGNLRLNLLLELKVDYLSVININIAGNNLVWEEIEEASYKITLLDQEFTVTENSFDLSLYKESLIESKTVLVLPIKEGFTGVVSEVNVKYNKSAIAEAYKLEFDEFDFPEFELNRSTYKNVEIDHEDHFLDIKEGRLTNKTEVPKIGEVALILRNEGSLELKEGYENFVSFEFNLGNYNNSSSTSVVYLYVSNNPSTNWNLVNTYNNDGIDGFIKVLITEDDISELINLNEKVYIKLETEIKGSGKNIVIDDVLVKQRTPDYFQTTVKSEVVELNSYYKSAEGLTGKSLVEELRLIISTNLNDIRYSDYKIIGEFADIKENDKNFVRGIYDVKDLKANWGSRSEWHREHVWPNSRLGMGRVKENEVNQASDPHNLRAIFPSTNSSRSNRYFDFEAGDSFGRTVSVDRYYPGDLDKGDVARILMYMVVRYEFLGLTDNISLLSRKAYTPEAGFMGLLSVLLSWHNEDPVDSFEEYRNEVIFTYQNNRNPFIDHPELFEEVFNYFLSVDENRTVTVSFFFSYEINFSEFKEDKRKKEF